MKEMTFEIGVLRIRVDNEGDASLDVYDSHTEGWETEAYGEDVVQVLRHLADFALAHMKNAKD